MWCHIIGVIEHASVSNDLHLLSINFTMRLLQEYNMKINMCVLWMCCLTEVSIKSSRIFKGNKAALMICFLVSPFCFGTLLKLRKSWFLKNYERIQKIKTTSAISRKVLIVLISWILNPDDTLRLRSRTRNWFYGDLSDALLQRAQGSEGPGQGGLGTQQPQQIISVIVSCLISSRT